MREVDRNRLNSWKEIADYLGCSEKTAHRWELSRRMPVHRVPGPGPKAPVFALRSELDEWLSRPAPEADIPAYASPPAASHVHSRLKWAVLLSLLALFSTVFALGVLQARGVRLVGSPIRIARSLAAKLPPLLFLRGQVIYQEQTNDYARFKMMQASLSGEGPSPLPLQLENADPGAISPDGSSILLRSLRGSKDGDEPLFLQPLPSGSAVPLSDIRAYDSAWTADGANIVFSRQRSVFLASKDGRVIRKLFDLPGRAYRFRWSPRNGQLRFTVYDSSRSSYRIWKADSLSAAPVQLDLGLGDSQQQCCGEWSPDGRIYYFQAVTGGFYHVFAHSEDPLDRVLRRGRSTQLTSGPLNYRSPLPLPDGSALLVLTQDVKSELVRYDPAIARWLPLLDGVPAAMAAFSPDGKLLAYTRPSDMSLWRCRMPGCTDNSLLIPPPLRSAMPRWSPDGRQIACMVRTLGQPWRIAIVPSAGGKIQYPLKGPGPEADPDWSPDGGQIVFGSPPNPDSTSEGGLGFVDLNTGQVRPLPLSAGLVTPRWSPNGHYLAAVISRTASPVLYEFESQRWIQLPGTRVGYLNWSQDSTTLFYLTGAGSSEPAYMATNAPTWNARPIARLSDLRKPSFSFGDWVGLGPGNTLLAVRDLSNEEILCWPIEQLRGLMSILPSPQRSACAATTPSSSAASP